jgi:acetyltransferase-like isoleucine patch superfamily enzyme
MSRMSKLIRQLTSGNTRLTKIALKNTPHQIGDYSYGTPVIRSWGEGTTLAIGRFCSIADNVQIFLGGNHRLDWVTTYPFIKELGWPEQSNSAASQSRGNVVIGNDVWIGSHATILSGVTLGDGCIVGAHSVVAKDVAPYDIVVGNPARVTRARFHPSIVEALLDIKWWHWENEKIRKFIPLLMSENLDAFILMARRDGSHLN